MRKDFFSSHYGKIYYELNGAEFAPAIVFIHGVGMNCHTFEKQIESLQPHYRTLVWDLPGHGRSTLKNYSKRFTELSAECLNKLLEELHISRAVLVGQSLGSMVAQHLQLKHPEKVLAAVHAPGIELRSHAGVWAKSIVPLFIFLIELIPENVFYKSFGKHRAFKKEVQESLSATMRETGKKFALKITADMCYDLIYSSPQPEKVPLLILYGEKDLPFIRNASKSWHARETMSQCVAIHQANHIANQDNPEAFNLAMHRFLDDL
ncbi:MAG: alpha/beta hydrolase [Cyclobacteriaceae bacterium]|nr:alpha/beta hydrolase [Cyclobacteriaceae bacterium]